MKGIAIVGTLVLSGLAAAAEFTGLGRDVVSTMAAKAGIGLPEDELGWMDDVELNASDLKRIAEITGQGHGSNLSVIRSMQAGARGSLTRRDFELLRQDRRRARAAYPDVAEDQLIAGRWFSVALSDRVPGRFCTSGNSNGTKGSDGKWYLDGGCLLAVVNPQYDRRADAATTKKVLAELKDGKRQKRLAHVRRWGYGSMSSGSGGIGGAESSVLVEANPDPLPTNKEPGGAHIAGKAVILLDGRDRYEFPFDAADWIDPPYSREALVAFAVSKGAVRTENVREPEKPWIVRDGMLARGQSMAPGRLGRSRWNAEKDDFDNIDIGPDAPASWVLDGVFGMSYVPAPDNGERRSEPDKPWYVVITYYGYPTTASGGWTEKDAKAALVDFVTGRTYSSANEDFETLNRGNLKEARATQIPPGPDVQLLVDRGRPIRPKPEVGRGQVSYSPGRP